MSWHTNEKVMAGVIVALTVNLTVSMGQAWYVVKTLDTDPPIVERVRVLELKTSALGETMAEVKGILNSLDETIWIVHSEQIKNTTRLDSLEKTK